MTDWKELEPAITDVVGALPRNGYLTLRKEGCVMQFAALETASGPVLRAEVCRDAPDDEPRLREQGWELVDTWSGLWRKDVPASSNPDPRRAALVVEAITALRVTFGVRDPAGFTYLSWQEAPPRAGWQFWKSGDDKDLTWPRLGLEKGSDKAE